MQERLQLKGRSGIRDRVTRQRPLLTPRYYAGFWTMCSVSMCCFRGSSSLCYCFICWCTLYHLLLLQHAVENLTAGDASKAELSPLKWNLPSQVELMKQSVGFLVFLVVFCLKCQQSVSEGKCIQISKSSCCKHMHIKYHFFVMPVDPVFFCWLESSR